MTRLHTQIDSVPGRALDALDVTRARRNGRRARRNCGCGPGCGCAPCMEKYGTQANPKWPRDSHADWVRGGGTRGDDETLWVVRVLDWNGQENDYINAYGKKAAAAHMKDAKRTYEKVWKVPAKMTDAGIVALDKLPRTNGARRNHHIRPGGTFYTPGGRRGTTRGPAKGGRYPVRWADGTLGFVQDTEQAAYPTAGSRANPAEQCPHCGHVVGQHKHYRGHTGAAHCTAGGCFCTYAPENIRAYWKKYPLPGRANPSAKKALPFWGDAEQKADAHRQVEAAYRQLKTSSYVAGHAHSAEMTGWLSHSVAAKAWEEAARQLSRLRSGSWGVTSAEAADDRYRAARAESDRIRAKFAPRSNPVRWMVIIPNQHGEERMFGPYPSEGKARERLRDLESKGREPDGRGGFHTFRYGTGRLKALR